MTVEHQIRARVKWQGVDGQVRRATWSDARIDWFRSSRDLRVMKQMMDNPISEELVEVFDAPTT